jgi:hypothetical protein
MVERPGADSEEKHEPVSDIDTAVVDSLKALDLERPIREADVGLEYEHPPGLDLPPIAGRFLHLEVFGIGVLELKSDAAAHDANTVNCVDDRFRVCL